MRRAAAMRRRSRAHWMMRHKLGWEFLATGSHELTQGEFLDTGSHELTQDEFLATDYQK